MTLVAQNPYEVQALQVLNTKGTWISPVLEPETFVVNLGDMMARLTNDIFLSTVHRVSNKSTQSRYSLALFYGINNDELITTRPQFVTSEKPLVKGYERGMTTYEHFNIRLQSAHHKHPSSTSDRSFALPPGMTKVDGTLIEGL
jgi:isopenicillin N synthase-like dioxygenase